jgi:DNA-binding CsgD family transcriptional regulator
LRSQTSSRGGTILRKTKKFQQLFGASQDSTHEQSSQNAERLVFCQKHTGTPKFQVEMNGDRDAALSRAASLLALGCMASGESPADYVVWVPAENGLIDRITRHAEELLHLGRGFSADVELSPRENDVLKELLNHRVNKEIADALCISVRTVKFHVSSLLAKFGVGSRWDLIQKARHMLGTKQVTDNFAKVEASSSPAQAPAATQNSASPRAAESRESKRQHTRVVPFRGGYLRPA